MTAGKDTRLSSRGVGLVLTRVLLAQSRYFPARWAVRTGTRGWSCERGGDKMGGEGRSRAEKVGMGRLRSVFNSVKGAQKPGLPALDTGLGQPGGEKNP